ncbi:deoxyribonuclease V [Pseudoalteromonas phenolica]|uniref:Endonuclease V n=1 Tax=Pseudoalteromonas phenolica TaxID=161398 RepID=A0A4Q7IP10_9GAMM|nr:deoxyribonuclease V [Pseudoalteromonas phenolica]
MEVTVTDKIHDAELLQATLAKQVITHNEFNSINTVAGVDVAYHEQSNQVVGAISVLDANTLELLETQVSIEEISFPYVPGLFSFRELPPLLNAFEKLTIKPDLIVCDGHGIAHPRRFGLACHLGVALNLPTIGCAKTRLIGDFLPVEQTRGQMSDLLFNEGLVGKVLRTQHNVKPVFVSIGHKISLDTAVDWVLKLSPKYRLPETTRQADQLVNKTLKSKLKLT